MLIYMRWLITVTCLTQEPEVLCSVSGPATYFHFSFADSRGAVVSYFVHKVLVNCIGGLCLPSVIYLKRFLEVNTGNDDMQINLPLLIKGKQGIYGRTSVARTLIARLPMAISSLFLSP